MKLPKLTIKSLKKGIATGFVNIKIDVDDCDCPCHKGIHVCGCDCDYLIEDTPRRPRRFGLI